MKEKLIKKFSIFLNEKKKNRSSYNMNIPYDDSWYDETWRDYDDYSTFDDWGYDSEDITLRYEKSRILSSLDFAKLALMGLLEYQDIVENTVEYIEKQMEVGSYGTHLIPPIDEIQDYIIRLIGIDYKEYITEDNLDNLSRYIYQQIDNYIYG